MNEIYKTELHLINIPKKINRMNWIGLVYKLYELNIDISHHLYLILYLKNNNGNKRIFSHYNRGRGQLGP